MFRRMRAITTSDYFEARFGPSVGVLYAAVAIMNLIVNIASMLAGLMSSCDAFMVAGSALFTGNIYRRVFVRHATDRHYMFVGRLVAVLIVGAAIVFAFSLESVVKGKLPQFMLFEGQLYLPWQMLIYLSVGLLTTVLVSLVTPPVPREKLDRFYACLRTPVEPGEPETEPFTLPPGVEPAPRRVWLDRFGLEIPRMTWLGFWGVALTALAVAALIGGVYWIFSLGQ